MEIQHVKHRAVDLAGVDIFYREAGPADAPPLLLLPGFPSSSHQFRHMLPALANQWPVVAPDFSGIRLQRLSGSQALCLHIRALHGHDPSLHRGVGPGTVCALCARLRCPGRVPLALRAPERAAAFVTQNSEAYYADGRSPAWSAMEAYWQDASPSTRDALRNVLFTEEGIRREFLEHLPPHVAELIDPDTIWLAWTHINQPGVLDALLDLHLDYRTNVDLYPHYQAYFREHRPPVLVIWGREDQYYVPAAAMAYRRDLPDAEVQVINGGHWALESHGPEIVDLTRGFLQRCWPSLRAA